MSFEQDYVMRLIHEMIRMLVKLLFNIDMDRPTFQIIDEVDDNGMLRRLIKMIDDGHINEAENQLYDIIECGDYNSEHDNSENNNLKIGLLFYDYLNEKNNDFLEEHDYSREEVEEGVKNLISIYGLSDMVNTLL